MDGFVLFGYYVSTVDLIISLFTLISGIYAFYISVQMKKEESRLSSKLVLPANCELKECTDKERFCRFMSPKLKLLGSVLVIFSPLYLLVMIAIQTGAISPEGYWLVLIPIAAVLSYYALSQNKAKKLFW